MKKVVLITGADGGIGRAISRELAACGYIVCLGGVKKEDLDKAFGPETPDRRHARFDAFDPASAEEWVMSVAGRYGRIDGLINVAGLAERVTLFDDNDDALDRLWTVNAKAPLRMTRLCIPHLEKAGQGRIVNLVSLAGKRVRDSALGYAMTKHAALAVSQNTRKLCWDKGIRCTAICPGWVRTPMSESAHNPSVAPEDMTRPETIATLVRTTIELPNSAAIADLVVNCESEDLF